MIYEESYNIESKKEEYEVEIESQLKRINTLLIIKHRHIQETVHMTWFYLDIS